MAVTCRRWVASFPYGECMKASQVAFDLIKEFEGLRLRSYKCSAGIWTIGWGSTENVTPNMVIDTAEAQHRFLDDMEEVDKALGRLLKVELTQYQYDALASFVFNLGASNLAQSTLLKRLNAGRLVDAANELLKWTRASGKIVPGLVRRRSIERDLFSLQSATAQQP